MSFTQILPKTALKCTIFFNIQKRPKKSGRMAKPFYLGKTFSKNATWQPRRNFLLSLSQQRKGKTSLRLLLINSLTGKIWRKSFFCTWRIQLRTPHFRGQSYKTNFVLKDKQGLWGVEGGGVIHKWRHGWRGEGVQDFVTAVLWP